MLMNGALRDSTLPGVSEQGSGVQMDRGMALRSAAVGYQANQKAQAAARQITMSRAQRAGEQMRRMQEARQNALLEMMYAHSVLGIPIQDLSQGVAMGIDTSKLEAQPGGQSGPMDNMAQTQVPGQPLMGALGQ
jgi:hypothetical protein